MQKTAVFVWTYLAGCVFFLSLPHPVQADQFSFSVEPSEKRIQIQPGKSVSLPYTFTNLGDPITATYQVKELQPEGMTGEMKVLENTSTALNFSVDTQDVPLNTAFFIRSQEQKTVTLTITVAPDAPEKDYYLALLLMSTPQPPTEGSTVIRLRAALGTKIILQVAKNTQLKRQGKVSIFDLKSSDYFSIGSLKVVDTKKYLPVKLIVDNPGNYLLQPEGKITLHSENKKTTTSYPLHKQTVLAKSQKLLFVPRTNDCSSTPKTELCDQTVSLVLPNNMFGFYTLTSNLTLSENTLHFASIKLLVFPITLAAICVSIFVLFCLGVYIVYMYKSSL